MIKKNVDGTRLPFLQESRKGSLRWQTSGPSYKGNTQTKTTEATSWKPNTLDLNLNVTETKKQWEAEMERLNFKYNLDCFLDSELDSESDKGEQY